MGLFRPYERSEKATRKQTSTVAQQPKPVPEPAEPKTVEGSSSNAKTTVVRGGKKSGPTPTRKAAEAARMERLHPTRTPKEQRRANREARYKAQQAAWERVERSPERALLRDYVDARWTLTEFLLPVLILMMALMMAQTMGFLTDPILVFAVSVSTWFIFLMAIVNWWLMWRGFKRVLHERFPGASTKGLLMYMVNRSMMIRRFRRPAPRIERGASF